MSGRHRALPSWMSRKEKVRDEEPLKSRRKMKSARTVFYCMNEKELAEAAVSYLTDGACEGVTLLSRQKQVADTMKVGGRAASSGPIAKPVTEAVEEDESSEVTSYVSETDLDITEVETVPYTSGPQQQGSEGQRSDAVPDKSSPTDAGPPVEEGEARLQKPEDADKDDALRLVREIFFT